MTMGNVPPTHWLAVGSAPPPPLIHTHYVQSSILTVKVSGPQDEEVSEVVSPW